MSHRDVRRTGGWSRTKISAVLLAMLCVGVMAAALRVSESRDEYQIRQGNAGERIAIRGGELSADRVRVASALGRGGELTAETQGMFVVVEVRLAATENRSVNLTSPQLLTRDGRTYVPYSSSFLKAVSGFQITNDVVFEVDPRHIDDLTLMLWEAEVVFQYQQRTRIHLGITTDNADEWRQAGRDQTVEPRRSETTEALP